MSHSIIKGWLQGSWLTCMDQILSQIFVDNFILYLGRKGDKQTNKEKPLYLSSTCFRDNSRFSLDTQNNVELAEMRRSWGPPNTLRELLTRGMHVVREVRAADLQESVFSSFTCSHTLLRPQLSRISSLLTASLIPSSTSCGSWPIQIKCVYLGPCKINTIGVDAQLYHRKEWWTLRKKNALTSKVLSGFKT